MDNKDIITKIKEIIFGVEEVVVEEATFESAVLADETVIFYEAFAVDSNHRITEYY